MASRREQKERLKAERLARERQAQAAERRKRLAGYGAGGVLAVAAVIALIVVIAAGGDGGGPAQAGESGDFPEGSVPAQQVTDLQQAADAAGCKLEDPPEEGSGHVEGEDISYKSNPPTSGDHRPVPADDGAYTAAPETEALVHSLEHGRVIVQFDPAVPDRVKGDLKALFDEDPYHVILTPNETDMPHEVAATAWGHLLGCPEMNEDAFDAIRAFRDDHRDEGPEFVP